MTQVSGLISRKTACVTLLVLVIFTGITIYYEEITEEVQDRFFVDYESLDEFDWVECPGPNSIVVTVVPGGRLGNAVWEFLSVWAVAQDLKKHVPTWPAVPKQILKSVSKPFVPHDVSALEKLALKCNASFLLDDLHNTPSSGNKHLLQEALTDRSRTRPFLLVLEKYVIDSVHTVSRWSQLRLQLPFKQELEERSQTTLLEIRNKLNIDTDDSPEFVGVHVRRTDFLNYVKNKFDTQPADEHFYLNAMTEMRRQLSPKRAVFVVVSDEPMWCRTHLSAPDVVVSGTGDIKHPEVDLALLSACNHTIYAYGTFGLTAAVHNPEGRTIVFSLAGHSNAALVFAKKLNWTVV